MINYNFTTENIWRNFSEAELPQYNVYEWTRL